MKIKNGKDEVTGEMIRGGGDVVAGFIWRLCKMTFESGIVAQDWTSTVIVPRYKERGLDLM